LPLYQNVDTHRGCEEQWVSMFFSYYYWTSKKKGKTVSRKLFREEAELLESWVNNRRVADDTIKRMMKVSEHALALTLAAQNRCR
jgi:N-glycosylase/DNA lyase